MITEANVYTGEDSEIVINLVDVNFSALADVIVGVITNKVLRKTLKKTSVVAANQVVAHPTDTKKCIARIFRAETTLWAKGPFVLEVTLVYVDAGFPAGKHVPYKQYMCEFEALETKDI